MFYEFYGIRQWIEKSKDFFFVGFDTIHKSHGSSKIHYYSIVSWLWISILIGISNFLWKFYLACIFLCYFYYAFCFIISYCLINGVTFSLLLWLIYNYGFSMINTGSWILFKLTVAIESTFYAFSLYYIVCKNKSFVFI
jgi:hypothetical protein